MLGIRQNRLSSMDDHILDTAISVQYQQPETVVQSEVSYLALARIEFGYLVPFS